MSAIVPRRLLALATVLLAGGIAALALPAGALAAGPHWIVSVQAAPAYFQAGSTSDFYEIVAVNDGAAPTSGEVTLTDVLPAGVTPTEEGSAFEGAIEPVGSLREKLACTSAGATVTCTTEATIPAGGFLTAKIDVDVSATATLEDAVSISGGGAATTASNDVATPVSDEAVPYGATIASELTDEEGGLDELAGSRPFAFTTLLDFNIGLLDTREECLETRGCGEVAANTKGVEVALPPGLVGDPAAVPLCSQADFQSESSISCPAESQVGGVLLLFGKNTPQYSPVYDVEPPPGRAAELGFTIGTLAHVPIYFDVRSESDYGVTGAIPEISEFDPVVAAALTLWGVPASAVHDRMRESFDCDSSVEPCAGAPTVEPFLTTPTSCSEAGLSIGLASDSWQQPLVEPTFGPDGEQLAEPLPTLEQIPLAGMSGCAALPFSPTVSAQPTSARAGAPTGYEVKLDVPQSEGAQAPASANLRHARVTLPAGMVISTSSGNGLTACGEAEFAPRSLAVSHCPPGSRVGTVKIVTPLLLAPMAGGVYIAEPECDPCDPEQAQAGQMVHLYLEAHGSGVVIKLAGQTSIDQANGRLTTTFDDNPQLPFSEVDVALEGGQDAPLANGQSCAAASTEAALTPWSSGTPVGVASTSAGLEGCAPLAFTPSLSAGTTSSTQAGAYTGLVVTIARPDDQQALSGVVLHTPPGLAAKLASVPLCGEAQANDGTCGASSQIGTATAVAGVGTEPLAIEGGHVYLTGPYDGAPFGLAIAVPADIGPFHLAGQTGQGGSGDGFVVIRASVALDPRTAALTIATGALPTQLDGIPLEVRKLIVDLDRQGFVFNPTNCEASSIASTITSASGATVSSAYPFQATGCAQLPFAPKLTVTTEVHHTRKDGAYLDVRVDTGAGEANVHKVHVTLPGKLPARLETLKLACTEAQFAANPGGCPAGSIVGTAVADTTVLSEPLTGPAIFVSRGGAEFPNLDLVMQGDGVTIVLEGDTFINPKGVTSSTFGTIPDVPVSSIEVKLPTGSNSALAGTGSLCRNALHMPTTITGQNGAVVESKVKLKVTGCKPEIEVLTHEVKAATARIGVSVPEPGRLVASGSGISRIVKRLSRPKTVTLEVQLTHEDRRLLSGHPGRRLRVDVKLRFVPRRGRALSSHVTVLMR